jgi:hypothetical protein
VVNELQMAFALVGWHALADYPLQGDFMARGKNHTAPIPGVPWETILASHSVIHGAGVAYITGSVVLGLAETVMHALIDHTKCAGQIGFRQDQLWHLVCKAMWLAFAPLGLP